MDGHYFDGFVSFSLNKAGDGVVIGARPNNDYCSVLKERFRIDTDVPYHCIVGKGSSSDIGDANMFLIRLEEHGQVRLMGLMNRSKAVHVWRVTEESHLSIMQGRAEKLTQERVTAPLGALHYSTRMDCSLVLRYAKMMRMPRDSLMLHLEDSNGVPVTIIMTFNSEAEVTKRQRSKDTRRRMSRRVSHARTVHDMYAEPAHGHEEDIARL